MHEEYHTLCPWLTSEIEKLLRVSGQDCSSFKIFFCFQSCPRTRNNKGISDVNRQEE